MASPVEIREDALSDIRPVASPTEIAKIFDPRKLMKFHLSAVACFAITTATRPPIAFAETVAVPAKKDLFTVQSTSTLFVTPAEFPVVGKVKSFEDLTKLLLLRQKGVSAWGTGEPTKTKQANWQPIGFTGVTGYYQIRVGR